MIRAISGDTQNVYLTFDDGPDGRQTEAVLDVLRRMQAPATFFLIGEKVAGQLSLVQKMVDDGHSLGNHSWDHRYRNFFTGSRRLQTWIRSTQDECARLNLPAPVGFRPPAGVVTPPLLKALREMDEPLILWNTRFYDAVLPWTLVKAERAAAQVQPGSIVLLHDRQRPLRVEEFCLSLERFIGVVRARGLNFSGLRRDRLDH